MVELLEIERQRRVVVGRIAAARRELEAAMKHMRVGIDRLQARLTHCFARDGQSRHEGYKACAKLAACDAALVESHGGSSPFPSDARRGGLLKHLAAGFA